MLTASSIADEEFPVIGTYLRAVAGTGTGSQRPDLLVTITKERIDSPMGVCNILSRRRQGNVITAHVECKIGGNQPILGDVTFRIRDERTVEFEDQDRTSDAILHRCVE